jgi:hypothetical protein
MKKGVWRARSGVPTTHEHRREMGDKSGWIYAAQEDGTPMVKIGCTEKRGIGSRMSSLASSIGHSLTIVGAVYVGGHVFQVEHLVHIALHAQRIEGEWFYLHMNRAVPQ